MQQMILPTNYGGKLNQPSFLHISEVSKKTIEELYATNYHIITADDSHPHNKIFRINCATVVPLTELNTSLTLHSHNMTLFEFVNFYFNNNPSLNCNMQSLCCLYFFVLK